MQKLHLVHYGPGPTSITKQLVEGLRPVLAGKYDVDELDLMIEQPTFFDTASMGAYVKRNYHAQELSVAEAQSLALADNFADRLLDSDLLILIFPMYNFGLPGIVKTWIDNVVQAKKLFRYTEYGAEGLTKVTKAVVVPVTGSTPLNSAKDFVNPYMDVILKFIGITNIASLGIYGTKFAGESLQQKVEDSVKSILAELAN